VEQALVEPIRVPPNQKSIFPLNIFRSAEYNKDIIDFPPITRCQGKGSLVKQQFINCENHYKKNSPHLALNMDYFRQNKINHNSFLVAVPLTLGWSRVGVGVDGGGGNNPKLTMVNLFVLIRY
jgi:hypothetical protein